MRQFSHCVSTVRITIISDRFDSVYLARKCLCEKIVQINIEMGLLELCQKYFHTTNLYDVLGIQKKQLKKKVSRYLKKRFILCWHEWHGAINHKHCLQLKKPTTNCPLRYILIESVRRISQKLLKNLRFLVVSTLFSVIRTKEPPMMKPSALTTRIIMLLWIETGQYTGGYYSRKSQRKILLHMKKSTLVSCKLRIAFCFCLNIESII